MKHLVVDHQVKDYTSWRKEFDKDDETRKKFNVRIENILRDKNDKNHITVVAGVPDYEAAQRFISSPELKKTMEKAGVIGQPQIQLCEDC